jgi:uncharacterized membrane protein YbaN (DUF454 family)
MRAVAQRAVFLLIGIAAILLAIAGLLLPLVPATPFVLLAAWAFSHSSPTMHRWILNLPFFGPALREWETRGAIRLRVKLFATAVLIGMSVYPMGFLDFAIWIKAIAGGLVVAALIFIWTRPSA